nr:glycosyltransferase family 4 protein [uncultured Adlercreutzia sp.]
MLVEAMRDAGIDVQVLASQDSLATSPDSYAKPDYVTFFPTYPLLSKTALNRIRNNLASCLSAIRSARSLGAFDVVLCSSPPLLLTLAAMSIASKLKAKLVLDIRDIWPDVAYEMGSFAPGSPYGRVFERIAKRGFRKADLVCTVSPGKVDKLRMKRSVNENDVLLAPNGLDETFVRQPILQDTVSRYRLNSGTTCVYIGNLGLAQGLQNLLVIAERFPNTRFLLFGSGAEEEALRRIAQNKELGNVEFCGTVDAAEAHTVLTCATLAYIPLVSSNLKDSIPTKLFEALGSGCPVLLAAAGDAADLLDEAGLGLHVPPEDIEGQVEAFAALAAKPYGESERQATKNYILAEHSRQKIAAQFSNEIKTRLAH